MALYTEWFSNYFLIAWQSNPRISLFAYKTVAQLLKQGANKEINRHCFTYINNAVNGLAWLPSFEDGCKCLSVMTLLTKQFIFSLAAGATIHNMVGTLVPFVSLIDSAGNCLRKYIVKKYFFLLSFSLRAKKLFWKEKI